MKSFMSVMLLLCSLMVAMLIVKAEESGTLVKELQKQFANLRQTSVASAATAVAGSDLSGTCTAVNGAPCVLPMWYKLRRYDGCIRHDNGNTPWCYTEPSTRAAGTGTGPSLAYANCQAGCKVAALPADFSVGFCGSDCAWMWRNVESDQPVADWKAQCATKNDGGRVCNAKTCQGCKDTIQYFYKNADTLWQTAIVNSNKEAATVNKVASFFG